MGYFSNGTEGMMYEEEWCSKCLHDSTTRNCAVWDAHFMFNYEECNKKDSILHLLIPMSKDGLFNEECKMFIKEEK